MWSSLNLPDTWLWRIPVLKPAFLIKSFHYLGIYYIHLFKHLFGNIPLQLICETQVVKCPYVNCKFKYSSICTLEFSFQHTASCEGDCRKCWSYNATYAVYRFLLVVAVMQYWLRHDMTLASGELCGVWQQEWYRLLILSNISWLYLVSPSCIK